MFIQGDLQSIFDALYQMGMIDPVLEMDWSEALDDYSHHYDRIEKVIEVVNTHQDGPGELAEKLKSFDHTVLSYLAMEVAREFAEYHSRETLQ